MPLLHSSGGLVYHLRARRWQHPLWAPFHLVVAQWLRQWQPARKHLVLVGPSGGYALAPDFLRQFPRITLLEPDPVARWLLRRRFPDIAFEPGDTRAFAAADGFARLVTRYPDAALLFCNLLGQDLVGQDDSAARRLWLERGCDALAGRPWASWHDLASAERPPEHQTALRAARAEPLEAALARYWQGGELEVVDHGLTGLCPDLSREYAIWPLLPGRFHLVEWLNQRS